MSNKYDKRGNKIYHKQDDGIEYWWEYDKNNNCIYFKSDYDHCECWYKYDENNKKSHYYYKNYRGFEEWYKYKNNKRIEITEKEYKNIQYNVGIREYNTRTKCSRFEIMEI